MSFFENCQDKKIDIFFVILSSNFNGDLFSVSKPQMQKTCKNNKIKIYIYIYIFLVRKKKASTSTV